MSISRILSALIIVATIPACGGGGDNGGNDRDFPNTPTPTTGGDNGGNDRRPSVPDFPTESDIRSRLDLRLIGAAPATVPAGTARQQLRTSGQNEAAYDLGLDALPGTASLDPQVRNAVRNGLIDLLGAEMDAIRAFDGTIHGRFEMGYDGNGNPRYLGAFFGGRKADRRELAARGVNGLALDDQFGGIGYEAYGTRPLPREWGTDSLFQFYLPSGGTNSHVAMVAPEERYGDGDFSDHVVGIFGDRSGRVTRSTGTGRYVGYGKFHYFDNSYYNQPNHLSRRREGMIGTYEGRMTSTVQFGAGTIQYNSDGSLRRSFTYGANPAPTDHGISISSSGGTFNRDGTIAGKFTATFECPSCQRRNRVSPTPLRGDVNGHFYGPDNENVGLTFRSHPDEATPNVEIGEFFLPRGARIQTCLLRGDGGEPRGSRRPCPRSLVGGAIFSRR